MTLDEIEHEIREITNDVHDILLRLQRLHQDAATLLIASRGSDG